MKIWVPSREIILARSAVQVAHSTDAVETTLATVTLPAGMMGLNGLVIIEALFSTTNVAAAGQQKFARIRWGGAAGTQIVAATLTTHLSSEFYRRVANRGAANSQVTSPGPVASFVMTGSAHTTMAVDTAAALDILFTGQLSAGALANTDSIALESYLVKVIPG